MDPDGRPVLKVRVRARSVEGEANAALLKLLAKTLKLPKSPCRWSGAGSRG
ncbi:MAG: DUF167 family protein [Brevundimonas sp.]|nr:DUF167 family protein [Brevundimonas sp.]